MENQNTSQLELFYQTGEHYESKTASAHSSLWSKVRTHEKTVLLCMGFLITALLSFSLGVQRGKNLAALDAVSRFDIASKDATPAAQPQKQGSKFIKETNQSPITPSAEVTTQAPAFKELLLNYTIQVASYQSRTEAQRVADALRKKGVATLTLGKGKYTALCIGNFSNKNKAEATLTQLRKKYRDCFIRRL